LIILSQIRNQPIKKSEITPKVSIIITAYNEEKLIAKKIENTLSLNYPKDKLEIIVVSDGSLDKTNEIVKRYKRQGVRLIELKHRRGKTAAQNEACKQVKGEINLFTDVTAIYKPDVIHKLVRNFSDNKVGCVTGKVLFATKDMGSIERGLTLRQKYELYFRNIQSKVHSLSFTSGCICAIRRKLCESLPEDLVSDLAMPLKIIEKKYKVIYEPEAVAIIERPLRMIDEFNRRVRIVAQSLYGLLYMRRLLNPFRYGFLFFLSILHRILRWLVPWFLIIIFTTNIFMCKINLYMWLFLLQIIFYMLALIGLLLERKETKVKTNAFFYLPLYFCVVNSAALVGLIKTILGKKFQIWEPVSR